MLLTLEKIQKLLSNSDKAAVTAIAFRPPPPQYSTAKDQPTGGEPGDEGNVALDNLMFGTSIETTGTGFVYVQSEQTVDPPPDQRCDHAA